MDYVLYDGKCALCTAFVGRLKARIETGTVVCFLDLRSPEGRLVLKEKGEQFISLYTMYATEGDRTHRKSRAVLRLLRLARCGIIANFLSIIPASWLDKAYDHVAKNRFLYSHFMSVRSGGMVREGGGHKRHGLPAPDHTC